MKNKTLRNTVLLLVAITVQPLFALAMMFAWNNTPGSSFLDYYHALLLSIAFSVLAVLVYFCNMIYEWLFVDEVFDYQRRDRKKEE